MTILDTREIFRRAYLQLLKEPGADLMTDYIEHGLRKTHRTDGALSRRFSASLTRLNKRSERSAQVADRPT